MATQVHAIEETAVHTAEAEPPAPLVSLEEYYREAGPDYAAWSREFNMHFGY